MNFLDAYFKIGEKMRSKAARTEFYAAIIEYYYKGTEPKFKTEAAEVGWQGVLYSLDKARAGRLGGMACQASTEANTEANDEADSQANTEANSEANTEASTEQKAKGSRTKRPTKEKEKYKPNGLYNPPNPPLPPLGEQEADAEFAAAALAAYAEETGQAIRCPSEKLLLSLGRIRRSGRTVGDCRDVARKMNGLWGADPKMRSAVRPSVVFGDKFEEYLAIEGPAGDWGGKTWE